MLDGQVPRSRASVGLWHRVFAGLWALACAGLLGVGWMLEPRADGYGTHEQLGFAPCLWVTEAGIPCPTCGMTTAVSFATHGHFLASVKSQPMGFLIAVFAAMSVWACGYVALTGSPLLLFLGKLWRPWLIWGIGGAALASWLYKYWMMTTGA